MADTAAQKARRQYRNISVPQLLSYRLPAADLARDGWAALAHAETNVGDVTD